MDWLTDTSVAEWHGDGATVIDHLTGETRRITGDCLAMATTNMANDALATDLRAAGRAFRSLGDCAAPRQAPYAFHDGRRAGLEIA